MKLIQINDRMNNHASTNEIFGGRSGVYIFMTLHPDNFLLSEQLGTRQVESASCSEHQLSQILYPSDKLYLPFPDFQTP